MSVTAPEMRYGITSRAKTCLSTGLASRQKPNARQRERVEVKLRFASGNRWVWLQRELQGKTDPCWLRLEAAYYKK